MSCAFNPGPGRADIDRWSRNPRSLLECETGRNMFLDFLSSRQFDQELSTVEFWIKAAEIRRIIRHNPDLPRNNILRKTNYLLELAEEVNFDGAQMKALSKMTKAQTNEEVVRILKQARQDASFLLKDVHEAFINHLQNQTARTC